MPSMSSGEQNIGEIGLTFRRQLRTIIYTAGPILAVLVGIALGLPDVYRSTGVIRIDRDVTGENRAVDTYVEYYVETLTGQVFTRENLTAWVDEFGVYESEPSWSNDRKRSEMYDDLSTRIVTTPVLDPRSGREREVVTGFSVSFDSHTAKEAYMVADAAVDAFLVENRRSREARGEDQIDFFKDEVEGYRANIAEVEARLAEFKERNARRLPDLIQVNMSAMDRVERDLESTQLQLDNLKRERVILQSQLSQIPSTSDEAIQQLAELQNEYVRVSSIYQDTHPTVVSIRKQIELLSQNVDSAAAIPILKQQQEDISSALAETREKYSDDHPSVRQLMRSERALNDRIDVLAASQSDARTPEFGSTNDLYVQLTTQIKAIDAQIIGLNTRSRDLRQKRQEYENLLLETPQVEREYQELLRDLDNARNLYNETQEKQREAELALALTRGSQGEQLILAQAPGVPSSPAWPPRAAIFILGIILAVGAGIGVATLRETSSGTVRGSRDVFELTGSPAIAIIPTIRNHSQKIKRRFYAVGFLASLSLVGSLAYLGANNL